MPAVKKVVGLAVIIATATVINGFIASPTFPQSLELNQSPSSLTSSEDASDISTIDIARPILIGGVAAVALTALGLATALLSGKNKEQLEAEVKRARELANAAKSSQLALNYSATKPGEQLLGNYEDGIKALAAELIESYHTQALTQATAQFWFSVTAASCGFFLILYTGFNSLRSKEPQLTLINVIPGIAIEAVAALFFTQAEGTRKRATELYDRLRFDDKQTQAITLIESIQNQELRDLVKAQWVLHIVGLESQPIDFSAYLPHMPLPNNEILQDEYSKTGIKDKQSSSFGQFLK